MGVDITHRLLDRAIGLHRQHRAEDLLLHHLHVVGGVDDQGRRDLAVLLLGQILIGRLHLDHPRALGPGVLDIAGDALVVALGDDGGVVGIVLDRWEHAVDGLAGLVDEHLQPVVGGQHVVGRQADLTGVQGLAVHDARRRGGVVGGAAEDHRALAAQLQSQRHQVFGRRPHDVPGDRGRAGEDQMVERQAGKGLSDLGAARKHRDLLVGERLGEHPRHQLRGRRGEFRRLDHRAVARRQNAGQGREGQVDRKVPRTDHADHALGLVADLGLGPEQPQDRRRGLAPLRPHPLAQVLLGELQRPDRTGDVGQGGGVARPRSEIGVERVLDLAAVIDQQPDAAVQPLDPLLGGRRAVTQMRGLLPVQNSHHRGAMVAAHPCWRVHVQAPPGRKGPALMINVQDGLDGRGRQGPV